MFNRWKYAEENASNLPLDLGRAYSVDLVGCDFSNGEASPAFYGWINRVRVYVNGRKGTGYCAGDNVDVVIKGYSDRSAFAEVTGINSCFLEKYAENDECVKVWKCRESRNDLRDVAGTLLLGKSDSGIFTIVRSAKIKDNDFSEGFDTIVGDIKRDKNGRYLVIGYPADDSRKRDRENELFVGDWHGWYGYGPTPTFDFIAERPGIPKRGFSGFFFGCRDGKRYIVTRSGQKAVPRPNDYELSDADALRYYMGSRRDKSDLKIALFEDGRPDGMPALEMAKNIMGPVAKDLHVEELPLRILF